MFKSFGKLEINNGVRIITSIDFVLYYKWLIEKHFYNTRKFQIPKHLAHSTLINPKIHKNVDISMAKKYVGKKIEFEYNPLEIYESKVNFWIPIICPEGDEIKKKCNVDDGKNYWGLHLTICNTKFDN
jgi:hypothetical protein